MYEENETIASIILSEIHFKMRTTESVQGNL